MFLPLEKTLIHYLKFMFSNFSIFPFLNHIIDFLTTFCLFLPRMSIIINALFIVDFVCILMENKQIFNKYVTFQSKSKLRFWKTIYSYLNLIFWFIKISFFFFNFFLSKLICFCARHGRDSPDHKQKNTNCNILVLLVAYES